MLTEQRKKELDILAQQANCAGDKYYFNMKQEVFNDSMSGHEDAEYYKAYCHQREIGFDEYQSFIAKKVATVILAEELHYLATDHNFDSGIWLLEQVVMNSACDCITAKEIYWLSTPCYYYDNFGSPSNCPQNNINVKTANFIVQLETKANDDGFQTGMKLDKEPLYEQPAGLNFNIEPYCQIPKAFR